MDKWQPDLEFITRIEKILSVANVLDRPYFFSQVGKTNRDIVEVLQEDAPKMADYIKRSFSLNQPICNHHLTGKEAMDAMREGTPYGILLYLTLEMHKDCCFKKGKDIDHH